MGDDADEIFLRLLPRRVFLVLAQNARKVLNPETNEYFFVPVRNSFRIAAPRVETEWASQLFDRILHMGTLLLDLDKAAQRIFLTEGGGELDPKMLADLVKQAQNDDSSMSTTIYLTVTCGEPFRNPFKPPPITLRTLATRFTAPFEIFASGGKNGSKLGSIDWWVEKNGIRFTDKYRLNGIMKSVKPPQGIPHKESCLGSAYFCRSLYVDIITPEGTFHITESQRIEFQKKVDALVPPTIKALHDRHELLCEILYSMARTNELILYVKGQLCLFPIVGNELDEDEEEKKKKQARLERLEQEELERAERNYQSKMQLKTNAKTGDDGKLQKWQLIAEQKRRREQQKADETKRLKDEMLSKFVFRKGRKVIVVIEATRAMGTQTKKTHISHLVNGILTSSLGTEGMFFLSTYGTSLQTYEYSTAMIKSTQSAVADASQWVSGGLPFIGPTDKADFAIAAALSAAKQTEGFKTLYILCSGTFSDSVMKSIYARLLFDSHDFKVIFIIVGVEDGNPTIVEGIRFTAEAIRGNYIELSESDMLKNDRQSAIMDHTLSHITKYGEDFCAPFAGEEAFRRKDTIPLLDGEGLLFTSSMTKIRISVRWEEVDVDDADEENAELQPPPGTRGIELFMLVFDNEGDYVDSITKKRKKCRAVGELNFGGIRKEGNRTIEEPSLEVKKAYERQLTQPRSLIKLQDEEAKDADSVGTPKTPGADTEDEDDDLLTEKEKEERDKKRKEEKEKKKKKKNKFFWKKTGEEWIDIDFALVGPVVHRFVIIARPQYGEWRHFSVVTGHIYDGTREGFEICSVSLPSPISFPETQKYAQAAAAAATNEFDPFSPNAGDGAGQQGLVGMFLKSDSPRGPPIPTPLDLFSIFRRKLLWGMKVDNFIFDRAKKNERKKKKAPSRLRLQMNSLPMISAADDDDEDDDDDDTAGKTPTTTGGSTPVPKKSSTSSSYSSPGYRRTNDEDQAWDDLEMVEIYKIMNDLEDFDLDEHPNLFLTRAEVKKRENIKKRKDRVWGAGSKEAEEEEEKQKKKETKKGSFRDDDDDEESEKTPKEEEEDEEDLSEGEYNEKKEMQKKRKLQRQLELFKSSASSSTEKGNNNNNQPSIPHGEYGGAIKAAADHKKMMIETRVKKMEDEQRDREKQLRELQSLHGGSRAELLASLREVEEGGDGNNNSDEEDGDEDKKSQTSSSNNNDDKKKKGAPVEETEEMKKKREEMKFALAEKERAERMAKQVQADIDDLTALIQRMPFPPIKAYGEGKMNPPIVTTPLPEWFFEHISFMIEAIKRIRGLGVNTDELSQKVFTLAPLEELKRVEKAKQEMDDFQQLIKMIGAFFAVCQRKQVTFMSPEEKEREYRESEQYQKEYARKMKEWNESAAGLDPNSLLIGGSPRIMSRKRIEESSERLAAFPFVIVKDGKEEDKFITEMEKESNASSNNNNNTSNNNNNSNNNEESSLIGKRRRGKLLKLAINVKMTPKEVMDGFLSQCGMALSLPVPPRFVTYNALPLSPNSFLKMAQQGRGGELFVYTSKPPKRIWDGLGGEQPKALLESSAVGGGEKEGDSEPTTATTTTATLREMKLREWLMKSKIEGMCERGLVQDVKESFPIIYPPSASIFQNSIYYKIEKISKEEAAAAKRLRSPSNNFRTLTVTAGAATPSDGNGNPLSPTAPSTSTSSPTSRKALSFEPASAVEHSFAAITENDSNAKNKSGGAIGFIECEAMETWEKGISKGLPEKIEKVRDQINNVLDVVIAAKTYFICTSDLRKLGAIAGNLFARKEPDILQIEQYFIETNPTLFSPAAAATELVFSSPPASMAAAVAAASATATLIAPKLPAPSLPTTTPTTTATTSSSSVDRPFFSCFSGKKWLFIFCCSAPQREVEAALFTFLSCLREANSYDGRELIAKRKRPATNPYHSPKARATYSSSDDDDDSGLDERGKSFLSRNDEASNNKSRAKVFINAISIGRKITVWRNQSTFFPATQENINELSQWVLTELNKLFILGGAAVSSSSGASTPSSSSGLQSPLAKFSSPQQLTSSLLNSDSDGPSFSLPSALALFNSSGVLPHSVTFSNNIVDSGPASAQQPIPSSAKSTSSAASWTVTTTSATTPTSPLFSPGSSSLVTPTSSRSVRSFSSSSPVSGSRSGRRVNGMSRSGGGKSGSIPFGHGEADAVFLMGGCGDESSGGGIGVGNVKMVADWIRLQNEKREKRFRDRVEKLRRQMQTVQKLEETPDQATSTATIIISEDETEDEDPKKVLFSPLPKSMLQKRRAEARKKAGEERFLSINSRSMSSAFGQEENSIDRMIAEELKKFQPKKIPLVCLTVGAEGPRSSIAAADLSRKFTELTPFTYSCRGEDALKGMKIFKEIDNLIRLTIAAHGVNPKPSLFLTTVFPPGHNFWMVLEQLSIACQVLAGPPLSIPSLEEEVGTGRNRISLDKIFKMVEEEINELFDFETQLKNDGWGGPAVCNLLNIRILRAPLSRQVPHITRPTKVYKRLPPSPLRKNKTNEDYDDLTEEQRLELQQQGIDVSSLFSPSPQWLRQQKSRQQQEATKTREKDDLEAAKVAAARNPSPMKKEKKSASTQVVVPEIKIIRDSLWEENEMNDDLLKTLMRNQTGARFYPLLEKREKEFAKKEREKREKEKEKVELERKRGGIPEDRFRPPKIESGGGGGGGGGKLVARPQSAPLVRPNSENKNNGGGGTASPTGFFYRQSSDNKQNNNNNGNNAPSAISPASPIISASRRRIAGFMLPPAALASLLPNSQSGQISSASILLSGNAMHVSDGHTISDGSTNDGSNLTVSDRRLSITSTSGEDYSSYYNNAGAGAGAGGGGARRGKARGIQVGMSAANYYEEEEKPFGMFQSSLPAKTRERIEMMKHQKELERRRGTTAASPNIVLRK